jgi:hypothetical protein
MNVDVFLITVHEKVSFNFPEMLRLFGDLKNALVININIISIY